ncbi:MAG TPA: HEPN domain-containing protein [Phycisphaerae bacterium]|nr:HEPN domain-containing protein [Phycisphaerae bacterium]
MVNTDTEFEYTGTWWRPPDTSKKLAGTLRHSPDKGTVLRVMETLQTRGGPRDDPLAVVHGTTGEAPFISLRGITELGHSGDYRGQYETTYAVDTTVLGDHIAPDAPPAFERLEVYFTSLAPWLSLPLFDDAALAGGGAIRQIELFPDKEMNLGVHENCSLTLSYGPSWESRGEGLSLSIVPYAYVAFDCGTPCDISRLSRYIAVFRDFLTFASGMPTAVMRIEAPPVRFTDRGHAHERLVYTREFAAPIRELGYHLFLFEFGEVQSCIADIIGAWYAAAERIQPVFDQYLAGCYAPEMGPEANFLATVQAVEAYHRRTRDNRELPEAEHEERLHRIMKAAPETHRKWITEKLRYSNEPSLRKRLKALFDENRDVLVQFTKLNRKVFVQTACDARNYLTHYDVSLEGKVPRGFELWKLIYSVQLLLDACLLRDLRVPTTTIVAFAKRKHMVLV